MLLVASQVYKTSGNEEYVINGNDVIMKCNIPSFVADFVQITGWIDSEGKEYLLDNNYGNSINNEVFFISKKSHLCNIKDLVSSTYVLRYFLGICYVLLSYNLK